MDRKENSVLLLPPDFEPGDSLYSEDKMLNQLDPSLRVLIVTLFSIFMVIGIVANSAALYFSSKRNLSQLSKCLYISLSLSDILIALSNGVINISKVIQKYKNNWCLGDVMCHLGPFAQTMGLIVNSLTLSCIALDRYKAVVNAMSARWNPSFRASVILCILIWIVSSCMYYIGVILHEPCCTVSLICIEMGIIYNTVKGYVVNEDAEFTKIYMCILLEKTEERIYFLFIFFSIFLPIFLSCIILYTIIAVFVWRRRKPQSPNKVVISESNSRKNMKSDSSNIATTSTQLSLDSIQNIESSGSTVPKVQNLRKKKSIHAQKKLRTFKIILTLMAIFFICRMPSWINNIVGLYHEMTQGYEWFLHHILSILSLINSAINPFLYCFMNDIFNLFTALKNKIKSFFGFFCYCQLMTLKRNGENLQCTNGSEVPDPPNDYLSKSLEARCPYVFDLTEKRKKTAPLGENSVFRRQS